MIFGCATQGAARAGRPWSRTLDGHSGTARRRQSTRTRPSLSERYALPSSPRKGLTCFDSIQIPRWRCGERTARTRLRLSGCGTARRSRRPARRRLRNRPRCTASTGSALTARPSHNDTTTAKRTAPVRIASSFKVDHKSGRPALFCT